MFSPFGCDGKPTDEAPNHDRTRDQFSARPDRPDSATNEAAAASLQPLKLW
jgi:hypothetical protein